MSAFMRTEATCIQMRRQCQDTSYFDLLDLFCVLVRKVTEALENKMALSAPSV